MGEEEDKGGVLLVDVVVDSKRSCTRWLLFEGESLCVVVVVVAVVIIIGRLDDWKKRLGLFFVVIVDVAQHDGVRGGRSRLAGCWGFKLLPSAAERMGRVLVCSIVSIRTRSWGVLLLWWFSTWACTRAFLDARDGKLCKVKYLSANRAVGV